MVPCSTQLLGSLHVTRTCPNNIYDTILGIIFLYIFKHVTFSSFACLFLPLGDFFWSIAVLCFYDISLPWKKNKILPVSLWCLQLGNVTLVILFSSTWNLKFRQKYFFFPWNKYTFIFLNFWRGWEGERLFTAAAIDQLLTIFRSKNFQRHLSARQRR